MTDHRQPGRPLNMLAGESSPYLLQHAANPVAWEPWGDAAFARAQREDKPVFLSVGYSTCHWCHVMERESFEDDTVAAVLNAGFVCVKVDREERPDLDEIYLAATQLLTGRGGWPNSVWLTPDRRPWYAGTYFPRDMFLNLLRQLRQAWAGRRPEIDNTAAQLAAAVRKVSNSPPAGGAGGPVSAAALAERAVVAAAETFEPRHGGFGGAPKFPPHATLRLLQRLPDLPGATAMSSQTLDAMFRGGIHDHVGGGFHRYSTDERWLLPHFEKMLYDNAQLLRLYAAAAAATGNPDFLAAATGIVSWLQREMRDPGGAFYAALDADSEGEEGKFYVWTTAEVSEILGSEDGELFRTTYGFDPGGNFRDEAGGHQSGANIPHLAASFTATAARLGLAEDELRRRLAGCREKLLERRARRVRPFLDDKLLVGWNGLLIEALAGAARLLGQPEWLALARGAADYLLANALPGGRLCRSLRQGQPKGHSCLDDCAYLGNGLLELHGATQDAAYLKAAARLAADIRVRHEDARLGGFFLAPDDRADLFSRTRPAHDNALPCPNAEAIRLFARLAPLLNDRALLDSARRALRSLQPWLERAPAATCDLAVAALELAAADAAFADSAKTAAAPQTGLTVSIECLPAAPGSAKRRQFRFHCVPASGWRVYAAAKPGAGATHEPFSISLAAGQPARLLKVEYAPAPAADGCHAEPFTAAVEVELDTAGGEPPALVFDIRFQACGPDACLPPACLRLACLPAKP